MRFTLSLLPILVSSLAFAADLPTRSVESVSDLSARTEDFLQSFGKGDWGHGGHGGGHGGGGHNGNQCKDNPLRDSKNHCECKGGLIDLMGSCCCGDQANTVLTLQGCGGGSGGCDKPVCVCDPEHSYYDKDQYKCVCRPGYIPTYDKKGILKCKPPLPSDTPYKNSKRELADAVSERNLEKKTTRPIEEIIGCSIEQKACQRGTAYVCTDVMSSLGSCGGCPDEAEDCAALPGVDQVRCEHGRCVIDSCVRGFTLEATDAPANSTLPAAICTSKKSSDPRLNVQERK